MDGVLTTEEAAAYMRVVPDTIRWWCRTGRIRAVRIGKDYRIRRSDLDALWEQADLSSHRERPHTEGAKG